MHALFECCCSVVWSNKVVDGRPYASHAALFTAADRELLSLSESDIEEALHCDHADSKLGDSELHDRIERMLGPEEGYPEF